MVKTISMHVLVSIAGKWQCISSFTFAVHATESIFLNIITNSLYTSEHYFAVTTDSGGTLKSAYEENIYYTYRLYKIIKPKA
jgi:hypothetical protein